MARNVSHADVVQAIFMIVLFVHQRLRVLDLRAAAGAQAG